MKQYTNYTKDKEHMLHITAQGLSNEEEAALNKTVRKMVRKRSHENRPRLLYDMTFHNKIEPGLLYTERTTNT